MILQTDFQHYLSLLAGIAGETGEDILHKRTYPFPYYRAMLVLALSACGHSVTAIMEAVGKDRTTFYHLRNLIDDLDGNPTMRPVAQIWNQFEREVGK